MSFVCLNHVAIYNNWTSALMLETSLLLGSKLRILLYWVCVSAFFCCAHARMIGRIFLCAFKRWYQATISGVGICLPWGHLDNQTSLAGAELVSAFKVPTAEGHEMALSFLLALPVAELRIRNSCCMRMSVCRQPSTAQPECPFLLSNISKTSKPWTFTVFPCWFSSFQ